jgi:hypothetical protein
MDIATLRRHAPSALDAQLILRSLERLGSASDDVAASFFARLARTSHAWEQVLPASAQERRARVSLIARWLTAHLDAPIVLASLLYRLGASAEGATASRLDCGLLTHALLDTLGEYDAEWDAATRTAWLRAGAWAAFCLRAGHDARLAGRVAARDAIHLAIAA